MQPGIRPVISYAWIARNNFKIETKEISSHRKSFAKPRGCILIRMRGKFPFGIFKFKNSDPQVIILIKNCKRVFGHKSMLGKQQVSDSMTTLSYILSDSIPSNWMETKFVTTSTPKEILFQSGHIIDIRIMQEENRKEIDADREHATINQNNYTSKTKGKIIPGVNNSSNPSTIGWYWETESFLGDIGKPTYWKGNLHSLMLRIFEIEFARCLLHQEGTEREDLIKFGFRPVKSLKIFKQRRQFLVVFLEALVIRSKSLANIKWLKFRLIRGSKPGTRFKKRARLRWLWDFG